jgi:glycosyltransferase involved in cell wall biosynthesis
VITILRVGTYPTKEKSSMGLHAAQLCKMEFVKTIFLAPREKSSRLNIGSNTRLIEGNFPSGAKLISNSYLILIAFQIKRIVNLLIFSLLGIKLLFLNKIHAIHIHSPMYILIAIVGFIGRKKIYITFHGTDFHRVKNAFWYKYLCFVFSRVFVISPDMIKDLAKIHGQNKVKLVRNGISLHKYINNNKPRSRQVIAVGVLKREKGFEFLIDAFTNLINKNLVNKYKLIIVGEGLLRTELQNKVDTLNMTKYIKLVGHKRLDELVQLYNESEVFVLSSISEGFPKVLLEALACGCNVVSTDVGAVKSILPHELLATHSNVDSLQKLILEVIKTKRGAIIDLNKFSWDSVISIYEEVYIEDLKCTP